MSDRRCPACSTPGLEPFYEAEAVPTNSCILLRTAEEARRYPRGDLLLAFCGECGFISNLRFEPDLTEYSGRYEETQGFSETFRAFHESLARELIDRHDLRDKDVLEIGCGKGDFLSLLVELGDNRGLGFDPAYVAERRKDTLSSRIEFRTEFFSEQHAHLAADFICCKMTLEQVHEPQALLRAVSDAAAQRENTVVFMQVPDVTRILRDCAFEDIYYEHCSYFSGGSLARLFRRFGLEVLSLESVFDGQYLTIEARRARDAATPGLVGEDDLDNHLRLISSFGERCRAKLDGWQDRIDGYRRADTSVVLWGSGSKAVSFLTTLDRTDVIRHVVDINPYRQECFMPGTGQPIVAPDHLLTLRPDVVIVLNRMYVREITATLSDRGLTPEVVAL